MQSIKIVKRGEMDRIKLSECISDRIGKDRPVDICKLRSTWLSDLAESKRINRERDAAMFRGLEVN